MLKGKAGVITGAAGGIGRGVALVMASEGARLVISDLASARGGGEETVRMIEALGGEALFQPCDVAKSEDSEALVGAAVAAFGRVDIAVNNAGILQPSAQIADLGEEIFDRVLRVNLTGVFLGMRAQLRRMVAQGEGSIVNIASVASFSAYGGIAGYVASKHGVLGLTRNAAREYGSLGIRVNCICPAGIRTPMMDATPPEMLDAVLRPQIIKRLGEPEDIGHAAAWLCSARASFVTGIALPVDGGTLVGSD